MKGETKAPKRLLRIAAILASLYLIGHLTGMREMTGVLSGTYPASQLSAYLGICYAIAWFAVVLVVPILTLGATLHYAIIGLAALAARRPNGLARREAETMEDANAVRARARS